MTFNEYPDRDMLMLFLARQLGRDLREALQRRARAVFAVPGGSTPGPVFDLLSAADLAWENVDILPGDERWVPETDPRSNARQIRERLMKGPAAQARLLPLWRSLPDPAQAADQVAQDLSTVLPLDVALVGMGADMHTASLFPGADALADALSPDAPTVMPITAPGAPEPRITLTARVFQAAYVTHVLITGDNKREALKRAQALDPLTAPINALLSRANVHWAP